jgi:hypothetical protein
MVSSSIHRWFSGALLLAFFGCNSPTSTSLSAIERASSVDLGVFSLNLRGGEYPDGSGIRQTERMQCFVDELNAYLDRTGGDWHLMGLQESDPVDCYLTQTTMHVAECLALGIANGRQTRVFTDGEYALIVNTDALEVVAGPLSSILGWSGADKRKVLAAKVRARANDATFLFATTHIISAGEGGPSSVKTNYCWREHQIEELFEEIGRWGRDAAIISGDFNCAYGGPKELTVCEPFPLSVAMTKAVSDRNLCAVISDRWEESAGFASIDHISMPRSRKNGAFISADELPVGVGCTDHNLRAAVIRMDPPPPPPCKPGYKQCGKKCCAPGAYCCGTSCCAEKCCGNHCC